MYDIKFSSIKRDGKITIAHICVYVGDITTENEFNAFSGNVPITRYRRTGKVIDVEFELNGDVLDADIIANMKTRLTQQQRNELIPQQK